MTDSPQPESPKKSRSRSPHNAFKRFEHLFAGALQGTLTVDALGLCPPLKAQSLASLLGQARQCYEAGGVHPTLFPVGTDLRCIRIRRDGDNVILHNPGMDRHRLANASRSKPTIELDAAGNIVKCHQTQLPDGRLDLWAGDPVVGVVLQDVRMGQINSMSTLIVIKGDISQLLEQYPELVLEDLGNGQWRLI